MTDQDLTGLARAYHRRFPGQGVSHTLRLGIERAIVLIADVLDWPSRPLTSSAARAST